MARAKKLRKGIQNIVVISDTHCGCGLGLIGKDGFELDTGGHYRPSRLQKKVYSWWEEFWYEWVPRVTHGEPFAVVHNGDGIEGVHHKATTMVTANIEDQKRIFSDVMKPIVDLCEGRFYMVRGTPAHVGPDASDEEGIARDIGAVPDRDGHRARFELWMRCGDGLIHFNHHIGTTSSSHHETSAVNAELGTAFVEAGRWGHEPPDIIVRSHRHRCSEVRLPSKKNKKRGYVTAFVTAAWQLKTPFLFKVAGGRMTMPQIGGSIIRMGEEELHTRHWVNDIERDPPEVVQ